LPMRGKTNIKCRQIVVNHLFKDGVRTTLLI
jgi:hypothetical protein